jgi:ribosome-associated protein
MLVVNRRIQIPRDELELQFSRSSGPGGQNVNKVNSKATLRWQVTASPSLPEDVRTRFCSRYRTRINKRGELILHSQTYRDQEKNIDDCLMRLRQMLLEVAVAPRSRRPTKPTRASKLRRLREKKARSNTKRLRRRPADDG